MQYITIITIAIGLAMDAFAVSIVSGAAFKKLNIRHALRMAAFFGAFQVFMPLLGALAGLTMKSYVESFGHWVAFALLLAVGAKMIYESFKIKEVESKNFDPSSISVLLILSVATSIDALVIGITLSLITSSVALAVIIIGLITFALSLLGVWIGKHFGHFFEIRMELIGGIVLIAIGLKILLQALLT